MKRIEDLIYEEYSANNNGHLEIDEPEYYIYCSGSPDHIDFIDSTINVNIDLINGWLGESARCDRLNHATEKSLLWK